MYTLAAMSDHQMAGLILTVYLLVMGVVYFGLIVLFRGSRGRAEQGEAVVIITVALFWPLFLILALALSGVNITRKLMG